MTPCYGRTVMQRTGQIKTRDQAGLVRCPQITTYARAMCEAVPSYEDQCYAYVDQYSPIVFGMALSYLQVMDDDKRIDPTHNLPCSVMQQTGK